VVGNSRRNEPTKKISPKPNQAIKQQTPSKFFPMVSSAIPKKIQPKKRNIYFPTLAYAPVPENKKVRFSSLRSSV